MKDDDPEPVGAVAGYFPNLSATPAPVGRGARVPDHRPSKIPSMPEPPRYPTAQTRREERALRQARRAYVRPKHVPGDCWCSRGYRCTG